MTISPVVVVVGLAGSLTSRLVYVSASAVVVVAAVVVIVLLVVALLLGGTLATVGVGLGALLVAVGSLGLNDSWLGGDGGSSGSRGRLSVRSRACGGSKSSARGRLGVVRLFCLVRSGVSSVRARLCRDRARLGC